MTDLDFSRKASQIRLAKIMELFASEPQTTAMLAKELHMSVQHAREYVKRLRAFKKIYRCGFKREGASGRKSPLYALGNKRDVPIPKAKTDAELCRDYRRRLKADPDRYIKYRGRINIAYRIKNPKRDEVVAALFGKSKENK